MARSRSSESGIPLSSILIGVKGGLLAGVDSTVIGA
jgi:hypothetical protein